MGLQYIKDDKGETTGVFIPIQEWNELKVKYEGIGDDVHTVPEWQKDIVRERMKNAKAEEYKTWEEVRQQIKLG